MRQPRMTLTGAAAAAVLAVCAPAGRLLPSLAVVWAVLSGWWAVTRWESRHRDQA